MSENFTKASRSLVRNERLVPLSLRRAADELPGNTNSGLPHFTQKSRVKESEIELATKGEAFPAILFWRGQSGGPSEEDVKNRVVWGFPMSWSIREAAYTKPFLALIRQEPSFSAWGTLETTADAVHRLIGYARDRGKILYSTDFSSFDQSVGPALGSFFWNAVRSSYPSSDWEELDAQQQNVTNIPLVISNHSVFSGEHGLSSGSGWTSLLGTGTHRLCQTVLCEHLGVEWWAGNQVHGDDGVLALDKSVTPQMIDDGYALFGLEANADKQFVGESDCVYLQRYYLEGHQGGMYPSYRALNSLMGQERFHDPDKWGPDMVVVRAIMILENVKWNPLFKSLVKFVMDGDKYRLGADWPGGVTALLSPAVLRKARSIANLVPSYNQEDRIGAINEFETVKMIRELS